MELDIIREAAERLIQIEEVMKLLKKEAEIHRAAVQEALEAAEEKGEEAKMTVATIVRHEGRIFQATSNFSLSADRKYEYSEEVVNWENELRIMKKNEIDNGIATLGKDEKKLVRRGTIVELKAVA